MLLYLFACVLSCFWLIVTLWTVTQQSPLFRGISQARILEWVAISFSRRSRPRDRTWVSCGSCIRRPILHHWIVITLQGGNYQHSHFIGKWGFENLSQVPAWLAEPAWELGITAHIFNHYLLSAKPDKLSWSMGCTISSLEHSLYSWTMSDKQGYILLLNLFNSKRTFKITE